MAAAADSSPAEGDLPLAEGAASPASSHLDDIEHDLDTVDAALAALAAGDIDGAESLAAGLASDVAAETDGPGGDGTIV